MFAKAEEAPSRDGMLMKELTGHDDQMAATMADTAAAGKVYRSDLAPCIDRACTPHMQPHMPARTYQPAQRHAYNARYIPLSGGMEVSSQRGPGVGSGGATRAQGRLLRRALQVQDDGLL